ncbi:hypothetical protein ACFSMW_03160 [Virgibacillus halophilus]|uniref:Peptidyl-prolyl cis-trans isomerase n=1 Tax=Tigheibacillus halophilus TaxID=361280 RepID=A0ABU5CAC2_9BACI|nr:hypothetical protein [Virgibacillus halophilus]
MIIPITGKVAYQITLDPTVWIFDNRKIKLEEAFTQSLPVEKEADDYSQKAAQRFNREFAQLEEPNFFPDHVAKVRGKDVLNNSYVMPVDAFLKNAGIANDATGAHLGTGADITTLSLDELRNSYFLFALDGKPLTVDGPVHVLFKDGSNQGNPIKYVKKIEIV